MIKRFNNVPWLRLLLLAVGAMILVATFKAYLNPAAIVDFANLGMC
ncbi:MAG TPA: hypothetical protein VM532_16805 [Burkholderiales bacterium]|nr:hypothetical protein [Burkholderiales bacterium]